MNQKEPNTPSSSTETAPTGIPSQRQRWLKYGLNVAVLILAVVAIVIFANWIAHRRYLRLDFTDTRRYSLSEQTTQLLRDLDSEVRITTLYARNSAQPELLRRVEDLLYEYERRSASVEVRRIDPALNIEERDQFIQEVMQRYAGQMDQQRKALEGARQSFESIREFATQQTEEAIPGALARLGEAESVDRRVTDLLQQLNRLFLRLDDTLTRVEDRVDEALAQDLPDFDAARSQVQSPLQQIESNVLQPAIDQFNQTIDASGTPDAVQDVLLGLRDQYQKMEQTVSETLETLEQSGSDSGYSELRNKLRQNNSIVVTVDRPAGGDNGGGEEAGSGSGSAEGGNNRGDVAVLTLDEIYPNRLRAAMSGNSQVQPEQGYQGEEVITGAIIRLTFEHNTRVVFVNPARQSVLGGGRRGQRQASFNAVAERLRKMNFEVSEWQPGGRTGPRGQPRPPEPRPTAEPGETLIFVVIPSSPSPRPSRTGPQVVQAVQQHLSEGQPVLAFASPSSPLTGGGSDPLAETLQEYGISVQRSRMVFTSQLARGDRVQPTTQMLLEQWPSAHPVGQAVSGLQGLIVQGVPIELPADPPEGVQAWPLATTEGDTWADTEFMRPQQASQDESDPTGPFTMAAAVEAKGNRLVLIGDRYWATDAITESGPQDVFSGQTLYSRFPANAELFVNSMYWLAGLDQLIAPGARTHEIRRIEPVSRPAMVAVWWIGLLGLPVACLGAGGIVWLTRRS